MKCFRAVLKSLLFAVALAGTGGAWAGEITVSAAASLGTVFQAIARDYEAAYPDARVLLNVAASGALLQQMRQGAPVDVFASADQETMDQAQKGGLIDAGQRRDFTGNRLVLVAPSDSPLSISELGELANAGISRIAIGNPASVPVGRYSRSALQAAGIWDDVQARLINTQNVRQALDYAARGEVDVAFVYATDALLMPERVRVLLEVPLATGIRYPVAPLTESANAGESRRFIAYLLSPAGQASLARYGFLQP